MDHVFVLYDRASESVWYPSDGALEAVGGVGKGNSIPFVDRPSPVALGDWLELHPESTIRLPSEQDYKTLNRPYLGIRLEDRDGALAINRVAEESPAAEAGLQVGDIFRSLGGHPVEERRDLRKVLMEFSAGDTVNLVVERDGKQVTLQAVLRKS